jgi:hypothetical protein
MSKLHVICHHHQFLIIIKPSNGFWSAVGLSPYPKKTSFVNTQLKFLQIRAVSKYVPIYPTLARLNGAQK